MQDIALLKILIMTRSAIATGIIFFLTFFNAWPQSNSKMDKYIDKKFLLGESPWWDADNNSLVFIDIEGKAFYTINHLTRKVEEHKTKWHPGTIVPTNKGNFLIAEGNTMYIANAEGLELCQLSTLNYSTDSLRFNDGKCAPNGTFWVGTVDCKYYSKPTARLYSFVDKNICTVLENITISNGICWSPDGQTMYYIDSPTRTVKAFDYDLETSRVSNERIAIRTPEKWGTPDGCCSDSKGNIWVAQWGGSCVALWNPTTGSLIKKLDVPAKNVTAVALGGENLDQLFITTASIAMEPGEENNYPNAGCIFTATVKTPGIAQTKWTEQ